MQNIISASQGMMMIMDGIVRILIFFFNPIAAVAQSVRARTTRMDAGCGTEKRTMTAMNKREDCQLSEDDDR